ncbi:MAG: uroporphyrinogen decarboxylase family protein [Verrucomicrobia bacterium]|nr:uroporphyrinogen decarboxylase family protein [Verrucomicrobiota bacterium]
MTSKQLVAAALRGEPTPRVPTGPLAVHYCARLAGHSLRRYSTDPAALAESVMRYYERFLPDAIWLSADTWVSAEAMGARVGATDDHQPLGGLGEPVVRTAADLDRIPPPDVSRQGRYPLMLEALARIVDALGRDVFIVACFDQYPFALAAALMGVNELMVRLHDDPPFVQALMARAADYALAYGRAQAQLGPDLLSGGDSPAGLIGPATYRALALPAEQKLIAALKAATGKPLSLHICGDATALLPAMATSGADVLELDHLVDLATACRTVGPEIGIWGNVDPVGILSRGTPQTVRATARSVLASLRAAGHRRFVLSSGCTLAVETPAANLDALLHAEG